MHKGYLSSEVSGLAWYRRVADPVGARRERGRSATRRLFASLAIAVVAGLIGWGLTPSAAGSRTAGSVAQRDAPYQLKTSLPASVGKMRRVFHATFGGTKLNTKIWRHVLPEGRQRS